MLKKIQLILSSVLTLIFSYLIISSNENIKVFSLTSFLIVLGLFAAAFILILLIYVLIYFIFSLTFKKDATYETYPKRRRFLFNIGIEYIMNMLDIELKCSGLDKLPKDRKYLIICNHRSLFDALAIQRCFKSDNFICISKPENFNLPIAGRWLKGMCHLAIDRENNRNALKTIIQAIKYIENDLFSICIFPEGTRNKKEGLLPFKAGCFKIPLKAKSPLVICTFKNTDKVFKNCIFRKTIIEMDVVDVLEYDDFKDLSTHELGFAARRKMVEHLNINETIEESTILIE